MASCTIYLSCVICFDEFNLQDRIPMVLPCGHTYVCQECTKRLTNCMECRRPLIVAPKRVERQPDIQPSNSLLLRSSISSVSSRGHIPTPTLKQPYEENHAPQIAKNLVLIALMEANQTHLLQANENDEECTEESKILDVLESTNALCGTYLVRTSAGLEILSCNPKEGKECVSDDIESSQTVPLIEYEPKKLEQWQTVQIVNVEDGVFKIARNAGYIVAKDEELVKVDVPIENSCRLESMRNIAQERKEELTQRITELEEITEELSSKIEKIKSEAPSYPIFSKPRDEHNSDVNNYSIVLKSSETYDEQSVTSSVDFESRTDLTSSTFDDNNEPREMRQTEQEVQKYTLVRDIPPIPPSAPSRTPGYLSWDITSGFAEIVCFPLNSYDSLDTLCYGSRNESRREDATLLRELEDSPLYSSVQNTQSSPGYSTIDFSTGFSGHRALTKIPRRNVSSIRRQVRFMRANKGISSFCGRETKNSLDDSDEALKFSKIMVMEYYQKKKK